MVGAIPSGRRVPRCPNVRYLRNTSSDLADELRTRSVYSLPAHRNTGNARKGHLKHHTDLTYRRAGQREAELQVQQFTRWTFRHGREIRLLRLLQNIDVHHEVTDLALQPVSFFVLQGFFIARFTPQCIIGTHQDPVFPPLQLDNRQAVLPSYFSGTGFTFQDREPQR